eukprot:31066-Pelagococcus_subviridis.AAC.3
MRRAREPPRVRRHLRGLPLRHPSLRREVPRRRQLSRFALLQRFILRPRQRRLIPRRLRVVRSIRSERRGGVERRQLKELKGIEVCRDRKRGAMGGETRRERSP